MLDKRSLSRRQYLFCYAYLVTGNAYQSALEAGYTENTARARSYALLLIPKIKDFLQEKMTLMEKEDDEQLKINLRCTCQIRDLSVPEDAKSMEEIHLDGAKFAIPEINRMKGYYAPTQQVNMNVEADPVKAEKEKAELDRLIQENKQEY